MIRSRNLIRRAGDALEPGELFIGEVGGVGTLCLKLFDTEHGSVFGALSEGPFGSLMTWFASDWTQPCLSFGKDWVLEEIYGPETFIQRSFTREHHLYVDDDGSIAWRFLPQGGGGPRTALAVVLGEPKERELGNSAAPIGAFRIWASREEFEHIRGSAIFQYPSKEKS